jgi:hypothetical protein
MPTPEDIRIKKSINHQNSARLNRNQRFLTKASTPITIVPDPVSFRINLTLYHKTTNPAGKVREERGDAELLPAPEPTLFI